MITPKLAGLLFKFKAEGDISEEARLEFNRLIEEDPDTSIALREMMRQWAESAGIIFNLTQDIILYAKELAPNLTINESTFDKCETILDFLVELEKIAQVESPEVFNTIEKALEGLDPYKESPLNAVHTALLLEVERQKQQKKLEKLTTLEITRNQPLSPTENLRFSSTTLNKIYVEGLMPNAMKEFTIVKQQLEGLQNKLLLDALKYKVAYIGHSKNNLEGVVGFQYDLDFEDRKALSEESALLTKAHYILSERFYEQTGGEFRDAAITLNQFCDDLGMPRKNGAHTTKNKERATVVFNLLTSAKVSIIAYLPGKTEPLRVSDGMWRPGAEIEGQKRGRWEQKILTFSRGVFHDDWQKHNKKLVGYIHKGFLELKADNKDKYAILLGGYLASFAKMNKYQIQSLTLLHLLKKTGLWEVDGETNPGRMREKLERALMRLVEVGILREWRIVEKSDIKTAVKEMSKAVNYEEPYEEIDNDEHEPEPNKWLKIWLNQRLIIAYPFDLDERGKINIEKRAKHIERATKARKTGKSNRLNA